MASNDEHLMNQLVKLGDMMGDGLHHEEPWIAREYRKISRILMPEIKEKEKATRIARNKALDAKVAQVLPNHKCKCGGNLKQSRSGSLVVNCTVCSLSFKFSKKK